METSLRLLENDRRNLSQIHSVQSRDELDRILGPGRAMKAFEKAKKAGKCRFIGFTDHFDPEVHAPLLKAYDKWDSVMMTVHEADHAYLSFEKTALPVAIERGLTFFDTAIVRSLNSISRSRLDKGAGEVVDQLAALLAPDQRHGRPAVLRVHCRQQHRQLLLRHQGTAARRPKASGARAERGRQGRRHHRSRSHRTRL